MVGWIAEQELEQLGAMKRYREAPELCERKNEGA